MIPTINKTPSGIVMPNIAVVDMVTSLLCIVVMLIVSLYEATPVLAMHLHVPLCPDSMSSIIILQLSMANAFPSVIMSPSNKILLPLPSLQLLPCGVF